MRKVPKIYFWASLKLTPNSWASQPTANSEYLSFCSLGLSWWRKVFRGCTAEEGRSAWYHRENSGNLVAGVEQWAIEHASQLIISLLEEAETSSCVLTWYYLSLIFCSSQSKMLSPKFCEDCFQVVEQQFVLGINQFAAGAWKALKKMSLYLQTFCFELILIWPCRSKSRFIAERSLFFSFRMGRGSSLPPNGMKKGELLSKILPLRTK